MLDLSSRVASSRLSKGTVSLNEPLFPLLGTGLTKARRKSSQHDRKIVDLDAI